MRIPAFSFLAFTSLYAGKFDYVITEPLLQQRMQKEFPIEYKTMLLTFYVANPKLHLDGNKQRLDFTGNLKIPDIHDSKGKAVSAVVNVTSRIAYPKGGNFYLRKIKVIDIKSRLVSAEMKSVLYATMDQLLNEYFMRRPVYSLKNENGLIKEAVKQIENVVIVKEGVKIIFNVG